MHNRSALAFVAAWFLVFFAFENIQISYGSWLETRFGLTTTARGNLSTLFGVFELMASGGSSLLLDRIGKKRGVVGGLIVATIGYAILFALGSTALPWALAAISISFLGFEFSVVSGVSVMSELVPTARGTMLALAVSTGAVGRMVADPLGSALTAKRRVLDRRTDFAYRGALNAMLFAVGVREGQAARRQDDVISKSPVTSPVHLWTKLNRSGIISPARPTGVGRCRILTSLISITYRRGALR